MFLKNLIKGRRTLGFKITLWYSLFFVLSALLLFGLAYVFLSQTLQRDAQTDISTQLSEISFLYSKGGMSFVESELADSKMHRELSRFFFRIADRKNRTIRIFFPGQWSEFKVSNLEEIDPDSREWISVPAKSFNKEYALKVTSTQLADGSWLQVGMSTESRQRVLTRFLESFMYVLVFLLFAGFVGGYSLSRQALQPIRDLIHTVRTIKLGQMDAQVPDVQANDELGELIELFSNMLTRIKTLIEGMKGSLDNVSHELRTPITRMHNIAESALTSEASLDTYREALEDFLEECDRLLKMLSTLMDISEAETGVMKLDWKEFSLKELVEPVVDVYSYVAEEKGFGIQTEVSQDFVVKGDFNRLSQALANLIDNAIKYTPENDSSVLVKAWKTPSEIILSVSDGGIGISEDELPKIWDRLYRGAESRKKADKGLGLGLSQVKAILRAHNGWVGVSSGLHTGTTFRMHIPQ